MTNLEARRGLQIYCARMKIGETYRDLKSLPSLTRLMNKQQVYMEKMMALLLLAFTIGLLVGEELRTCSTASRLRPMSASQKKIVSPAPLP